MSELAFLDPEALLRYAAAQRWYGGPPLEQARPAIAAATVVGGRAPLLAHVVLEASGPSEPAVLYQLPLAVYPAGKGPAAAGALVQEGDGHRVFDAMRVAEAAATFMRLCRAGGTSAAPSLVHVDPSWTAAQGEPARVLGADQTNSSVLFGDAAFFKLYRRLEAGPNPELELLSFLAEQRFPHAPGLLGYLSFPGPPVEATAGVLVRAVADARDGWWIVREALRTRRADDVLDELEALGTAVGLLHSCLAAATLPAFAPEEPGPETLALLLARLEEEVEATMASLPELAQLRELRERAPEIVERLRMQRRPDSIGRLIRIHGDLHLGQALRGPTGWVLIDFEGEPQRSLLERRHKASPLRDVAGMLRSISYAATASQIAGEAPPADWQVRARERFFGGYAAAVAPSGLLPPPATVADLLRLHEFEKAAYDVRYELAHRPGWLSVAAAALLALLDEDGEG